MKDVCSYIEDFDKQYGCIEGCIEKVINSFPLNDKKEEVLCKIVLINSFYHTRIKDKDMLIFAKHISSIKDLDRLIEAGNLSAVEMIGHTPEGMCDAMSFASKYCNWHNHEKFPVFDGYSRGALHKITNAQYPKSLLYDYRTFCDKLNDYIDDSNLKNYRYKQIDKYLWMYGKMNSKYI